MKSIKPAYLLLLIFTVMVAFSCKKSVEGETSKWEANKRELQELRTMYPGFSKVLSEQLAEAEQKWNRAEGATDDQGKIDLMAQANAQISGGWINQLSQIDRKKRKLRDDIVKLKGLKMDEADRSASNAAARNAEQTISEVDQRLGRGAISASSATTIVKNAYNNLESSLKTVDKIESQIKAKDSKAKKKASSDKEELKKKNANWKCSFCGKSNKAGATECGGCGAPK